MIAIDVRHTAHAGAHRFSAFTYSDALTSDSEILGRLRWASRPLLRCTATNTGRRRLIYDTARHALFAYCRREARSLRKYYFRQIDYRFTAARFQ
jgi:hypothetical protein